MHSPPKADGQNAGSRKEAKMQTRTQNLIALALGFLATVPCRAWTLRQVASVDNDGCTLAIVSKSIKTSGKICDRETVRELAQTGHVFQQNQLGIASVLAIGPDYSTQEAVRWFEKAALNGYAPAQVNLAVMYANGWGTAKNYGAALRWLTAAADQHYARAYYNLGLLYLQGAGVRKDYAEALKFFRKGADAGDTSAQTNLGYMYDQGLGVPRDAATAAQWYRKAADGGNALGENNLADMYLRGEGVRQDDAAAFHLFQQAAAQGHTGAQIKLGYMYATGRGTATDVEVAYGWLAAASLAGDKRGDDLIHSLERKLKREQIARATDRARALRAPSPVVPAQSMLP
jgi:TPR repeat protein